MFRQLNFSTVLCLLLVPATAPAAISIFGFGAAEWQASDSALGIGGAIIEDFEDANLISELSVSVTSGNGSYGPASTLPNTFNPNTDPFGNAFVGGNWDGALGFINTRDNQSQNYGDNNNWGDVTFQFSNPMASVGFSVQQMQGDAPLTLNGSSLGGLLALSGLPVSGGHNGYIRIDADGGDTISTLALDNAFGDGFMIDHLAVKPVPEPVYATGLVAFPFLVWHRCRWRGYNFDPGPG